MRAGALGAVLLLCFAGTARADDTRPASLQVEAAGRDTYAVRWQTPVQGGATLRLQPRLPDGAQRVEGSYRRALLGDALVETWRVTLPGGLAGRELGVEGPAVGVRSTIVFVRLGPGRVHRAVLSGPRTALQVPEAVLGARAHPGTRVAEAAHEGLRDGLGLAHLLLVLALVALLGLRGAGWPLVGFLVGQVLGAWLPLPALPVGLGTAGVALAALLLAREGRLGRARRVVVLSALAGAVFGAAAGHERAGLHALAWAVGTDGAHLATAAVCHLLLRLPLARARRAACFLPVGAFAAAAALVATLAPTVRAQPPGDAAPTVPMALVADATAQSARSRAVEGLDVFLDVGVFETRVEVLGRLEVLARWLAVGLPAPSPDMPGPAILPVAAQPPWLASARAALQGKLRVVLDGAVVEPGSARAAFTTSDAAGVYLRDAPADETVAEAVVGMLFTYGTADVPSEASLSFADLPDAPLAARVIDPEVGRDASLSREAPRLAWTNELRQDPLPPLEAVALERRPVRVPLVPLLGALLAAVLVWPAARRAWSARPRWARVAAVRALLAGAALAAGVLLVPVPGLSAEADASDETQQRAIAATLIDNLYRAFNARGEDAVYDRLALSLVGDELEEAYVETQRLLAERRFGGARTHVEVVELHELAGVAPRAGGGFEADATWTVAGTVTHFGHRHLRRNRYEARIAIAPVDGAWKIQTLDVRATTREK